MVALFAVGIVVAAQLIASYSQVSDCNYAVIYDYYNGSRWEVPTDMISFEIWDFTSQSNYIGYEFRCMSDGMGSYNLSIISTDGMNETLINDYSELKFSVSSYYCNSNDTCSSIKLRYLDYPQNNSVTGNCSMAFGLVAIEMIPFRCQTNAYNQSLMVYNCDSNTGEESMEYFANDGCYNPMTNYVDNCYVECVNGNNGFVTTTMFQTTSAPSLGMYSYCDSVNWGDYVLPIGSCAYKQHTASADMSMLYECDENGTLWEFVYSNLDCSGDAVSQDVSSEMGYICNTNTSCDTASITLGQISNNNTFLMDTICIYEEYEEFEVVLDACLDMSSNTSMMIIDCNSHGDVLRYSFNEVNCSGDAQIDMTGVNCASCSGEVMNYLECPSVVIGNGAVPLGVCTKYGSAYTCDDFGNLIETLYTFPNCTGFVISMDIVIENEWYCSNNSNNSTECDYFTIVLEDSDCFIDQDVSLLDEVSSSFLLDVCVNAVDGTSTIYSNCTNNGVDYYVYADWDCYGDVIENGRWKNCVECFTFSQNVTTTSTPTTSSTTSSTTTTTKSSTSSTTSTAASTTSSSSTTSTHASSSTTTTTTSSTTSTTSTAQATTSSILRETTNAAVMKMGISILSFMTTILIFLS